MPMCNEGVPCQNPEFLPQNGLLLAQLAPRFVFAAERDSENRLSDFTGEQFIYHNAPQIGEPVMARLIMRPLDDTTLHNVRELAVFIPEDEQHWKDDQPLFSFVEVTSSNGLKFTYGISENEVYEYSEGDRPFAQVVNGNNEPEVIFDAIPAAESVSAADEIGEPDLTPQRAAHLKWVAGALSECVHKYGLVSQEVDRRIS